MRTRSKKKKSQKGNLGTCWSYQNRKSVVGSGMELSNKEIASSEFQRRDGIFTWVIFKYQQITDLEDWTPKCPILRIY